jgi:hypothetical protein
MPRSEEEKLDRKIDMARTTNAGLVREIEMLGGDVDLATARVEFLMHWLEEAGVVTPLQRRQEQLAWEQGLRPQLIAMRDNRKAAVQQRVEEQKRRLAASKPPDEKPPEGPKLIIPGR